MLSNGQAFKPGKGRMHERNAQRPTQTIAVATVEASDVRPVGERDVSHVRELQSA